MSLPANLRKAWDTDDPRTANELLPLVYEELRQLAMQRLAQEKPGQTLEPAALVHEAYLRLTSSGRDAAHHPLWDSRDHFFAAAAEAMRRILVDNARRKKRSKHGGDCQRVEMDQADLPVRVTPEELLALDEALCQLALEDPAAAQIVHLRFFAGCSIEDGADVLGISRATAYRLWSYARAWLRCALSDESIPSEGPLETDS